MNQPGHPTGELRVSNGRAVHTHRGAYATGCTPTHQPKPETMLCQARQMPSSASPLAGASGSQASAEMCPGSSGPASRSTRARTAARDARVPMDSAGNGQARESAQEEQRGAANMGIITHATTRSSPGQCIRVVWAREASCTCAPASSIFRRRRGHWGSSARTHVAQRHTCAAGNLAFCGARRQPG